MVVPPPTNCLRRLVLAVALVALGGCASGGVGEMTASVAASAKSLGGAREMGEALTVQMFVASTRRDDTRVGDAVADGGVRHSLVLASVPPAHRPGAIELPTFGKPDLQRHFALTGARNLSSERFASEIANHLSGRVGVNRDVLVFVHGFNTSLDEARFRLAQIVADARFGGVPVLYTWPSQSSVFSYVAAKERATSSRDGLEQLLRDLAATPGVGRVHVLAHSMGAWLTMEALRENAIGGHPDLDGKLGEVMLAAPDIDLSVFANQMARLQGRARVSVLVARDDRALNLSSRIAGDRPRVGALDPTKSGDAAQLAQLGVRVYDVSAFADGLIGHNAFADAPRVIQGIGAQLNKPRAGEEPSMAMIKGPDEDAPTPAPATAPDSVAATAADASAH